MEKFVRFALGTFALVLIVVACSTQPTPEAPPTVDPKVLRIGSGTYPDVFDPQKSSFVNEIEILQLAYEGLLRIDAKGDIGPGAADKWTLSDDAMTMTFHIRDGLKRADGTPMGCADFEYALRREVDPRVPGKQYTSLVYDLRGAEELDALAADDPTTIDPAAVQAAYQNYGVSCTDPRTLRLEFKKPTGFWDYVAYTWVVYPTWQKAVDADPDAWWTKPGGHNGNGPYIVSEIIDDKKIVLTANPNYWQGKPKIERIELIYTNDTQLSFEAYQKGELEIISVAPEWFQQVNGTQNLQADLVRFPAASTFGMTFNHADKRFQDRNVRAAFSQALDREGWVNDVLKGIGKPYTRWMPPGVPGARPDEPGVPNSDTAAARRTLVEDGYAAADSTADKPKVDCAKLGDLKLSYGASPMNHSRYQYLANNLFDAFGCQVTLDPIEPTALAALSKNPKTFPLLSRQGWVQDYPHPSNWLSVYFTCSGFAALSSYCNKEFDALTAQADATSNFEQALKLYQQAEQVLLNDIPTAFQNYGENLYLVKPYVLGPRDNTSSSDAAWPGQHGPVITYDIDLTRVGESYPKK